MEIHVTRKLRKSLTPWERKLWQILRNRNLKGAKFRRQLKIGRYIVDFCCLNVKLIIELDGGHHYSPENMIADEQRQKYLENLGFQILRFQNIDIDRNLDGVADRICEYL